MVYCMVNSPTCFRLDMQEVVRARSRACCRAGRSIEARMAMIAITTRSSISVKYLSLMFHSFFCGFVPSGAVRMRAVLNSALIIPGTAPICNRQSVRKSANIARKNLSKKMVSRVDFCGDGDQITGKADCRNDRSGKERCDRWTSLCITGSTSMNCRRCRSRSMRTGPVFRGFCAVRRW